MSGSEEGGRVGGWRDGWLLFGVLAVATGVLLALDRVPRFYQGDSIAYLSAGMNGWIPLDRSWAYGIGGRWLLVASGRTVSLIAVQAGLVASGLFLVQRGVRGWRSGWRFPVWLPCLLVMDPLVQGFARFWLTDAPACGLFLCALGCVPPGGGRWGWMRMAGAVGFTVATIFLRVAYLPVMLGTLLLCLAATTRVRAAAGSGSRWRLLGLCAVPVLATALLGWANGRMAPGAEHGRFVVNGKSSLYTMGVFLPALRYGDFRRAGVPVTRDEVSAWRLGDYGHRETAIWADGPGNVSWLMQRRLGLPPENAAFEQRCAAVVRSAVLHHPWDLAATYAWSTLLYFSPHGWRRVERGELGFEQALPDWVVGMLRWRTGGPWPADMHAMASPLPTVLGVVIGIYPLLLAGGIAASVRILVRRAPFDGADLLAAAMLASFAAAPLYSHALKPRYVLGAVLLAEWTIGLVAVNDGRALLARWRGRGNGSAARRGVRGSFEPAGGSSKRQGSGTAPVSGGEPGNATATGRGVGTFAGDG